MKKYILLLCIIGFSTLKGQVDPNLLLVLNSGTTAEINNIVGAPSGSLVFNVDEGKMYLNTGSGFAEIPDVDTNSVGFWGTEGTLGTDATVNFLGTIDAQDMIIRANNQERIRFSATNPSVLINGDLSVRNITTATSDLDVLVTTATGVIQKRPFSDFLGSNIPKLNFGGRWTNTDITTNLNINNIVAPIFGDEDYKDDANALYEVIGNTLVVKETGRYEIKANLSMAGVDDGDGAAQRTNVNARIAINGTLVGALAASGYIRFQANGSFNTSIHINEVLQLDANDVVSIITFQSANTGQVFFSSANESSISINKLR